MERDHTAQGTSVGLAVPTSVTSTADQPETLLLYPGCVGALQLSPSGAVLKMQTKPLSFIYKTVSAGKNHCLHGLRVTGILRLLPLSQGNSKRKERGHGAKGHLAHSSFRQQGSKDASRKTLSQGRWNRTAYAQCEIDKMTPVLFIWTIHFLILC